MKTFWNGFWDGLAYTSALIFVVLCIGAAIDYLKGYNGDVVVKYDCRLAEISPDYPVAVKNECRKLLQGFAN